MLSNIVNISSNIYNSNENLEFKKTYETIKNNYILCKTNYEKQRLLEEFDREYAKQFGFNFNQEISDKKYSTHHKDTIRLN